MSDLKPCPFCGGTPTLFHCDATGDYHTTTETSALCGRTHLKYICLKCGIETKPYPTSRDLWRAWNRRNENE